MSIQSLKLYNQWYLLLFILMWHVLAKLKLYIYILFDFMYINLFQKKNILFAIYIHCIFFTNKLQAFLRSCLNFSHCCVLIFMSTPEIRKHSPVDFHVFFMSILESGNYFPGGCSCI